jgi:RHS repeat-associated protein
VKSTINGVTTAFIGNHTEWDVASSSLTRYYYAGSTRIAMRKNNTVYYLLSDHFGSTSVTTDQNGQNPVKQYYLPWGEVRYSSGSLQTKYTYTGQYSNVTDFGLMYYNARYYDPLLSRFSSADTIIPQPGKPLDWDRYAYVNNNPIRNIDPSGHITQEEDQDAGNILQQLEAFDVAIKIDWGTKQNKWNNGLWTLNELRMVLDAVTDLAISMGGSDNFKSYLGGVLITQKVMKHGGLGTAHKVTLNASNFSKWTVVHELAHAWDGVNSWNLSDNMQHDLGAGFRHPIRHFLNDNDPRYWYDPGNGPPPCGIDGNFNAKEDFAESVTAYTYLAEALAKASSGNYPYNDSGRGYSYSGFQNTPRGQYIQALMVTH